MRLFVGVELDEAVRAAVLRAADRLRRRLARAGITLDARWIAAENLHITLWFIGEAADERSDAVARALLPAFDVAAFDISVGGFGAFPPSGQPRVFWLGLTAGADGMRRLYAAIERRLVPIGFEPERRAYAPHLTVARVREVAKGSPREVRAILGALDADCGSCRVAAVTLFRSRLSPKGAAYEPLLRVPLV